MGVVSTWKQDDLKVIMKGQKGQSGEGGQEAPDNVEITQEDIEDILDGMSDDHKPGEEQGEKADIPDDTTESEIDENGNKIDKEVEQGGKKGQGQEPEPGEEGAESTGKEGSGGGGPGKGKPMNKNLDVNKIQPKFNWKTLIQRFIMSRKPKSEETYSKPSPKGVTGAHIASQLGAAAIKPGEKPLDEVDAKLGFVIDSSASMSSVITTVMANAIALLKQPMFKKATVTVIKYSGNNSMHKVIFAQNKAAEVENAAEKPKIWPLKATDAVFGKHIGAGTNFDAALTARIQSMLSLGYNVVFFPDSDILAGANLVNFISVFKTHAQQVFVVFDCHRSYIDFRQKVGTCTANITYFPGRG